MSWRIVSAVLAASWLFPGLGYSQQTEPTFEVKSIEMPPAGNGLPGGKPIDILGLHTGMPADEALKVFTKYYKDAGAQYTTSMVRLKHASKPYVGYAGPQLMYNTFSEGDFFSIALTSNAAGNQVVGIIRDVKYGVGKEANTEQTIAAIVAKYGEPSSREESETSILFRYAYRDGELLKDPDAVRSCVASLGDATLRLSVTTKIEEYYDSMLKAAESNLFTVGNRKPCSALLYIKMYFRSYQGRANPKMLSNLGVAFFDAARFVVAHNQTVATQKELIEKVKAGAPSGSGSSKL